MKVSEMKGLGLFIIALGILTIIMAATAAASYPGSMVQQMKESAQQKIPWFGGEIENPFKGLLLFWVNLCNLIQLLIINQFIAGAALIASGYAIMTTPETKKEES